MNKENRKKRTIEILLVCIVWGCITAYYSAGIIVVIIGGFLIPILVDIRKALMEGKTWND